MNVKEYISSGIIESYVLGLASAEESREFETTCAQYPEVAEARDRFERQLEESLLADAPAPPDALKTRIFAALEGEAAAPAVEERPVRMAPVRRINPWKWAAAACALLAAGSLYWAFSLNGKVTELTNTTARLDSMQRQLNTTQQELTAIREDAGALQKPGVKLVSLNGTPAAPQSKVMVFWDSTSKDVYMMIQNMPKPASDKQYQLWAIFNGQPVDLGAFDIRQDRLLIRAKNVQNAQAFAITLEPKGGSATPTMPIVAVGQL